MMKKNVFLLASVLSTCTALFGQSISISGNPGTMTISSATAGQNPASVSDSTTTYSVTALLVTRIVLGSINSNMPTGMTLSVQLQAPIGATSTGSIPMTTTNSTLVTGIPILTLLNNLTVTYTLAATAAASPVTNGSRIVTLTIQ